jgi:hypothetical protein
VHALVDEGPMLSSLLGEALRCFATFHVTTMCSPNTRNMSRKMSVTHAPFDTRHLHFPQQLYEVTYFARGTVHLTEFIAASRPRTSQITICRDRPTCTKPFHDMRNSNVFGHEPWFAWILPTLSDLDLCLEDLTHARSARRMFSSPLISAYQTTCRR